VRRGIEKTLKVFLTGATGFVGSHVAQALSDAGADLRLLVRPTSRRDNIAHLQADIALGDLRDGVSLRSAMYGCEYLFHVAADYRLWTPDPEEMYASNVAGTESLIRAAQEAGVKRIVYCSSVATMGFGNGGLITDEETPVQLSDMIGHYKRSKFLAEQVAVDAAKRGVDIVIVNPSTPIGEQDIKPTPTGRIVVDFLKRKFPAYVDTGLNLVDVKDVARGHLLAVEKGRSGVRYIIGGENLTLKEVLDKLAAITGLPSPSVRVPHAVAMAFGVFDEFWTGHIRGKEPRATIDAVRMERKKMWVSSSRAERELGYKPTPVDDSLRRAAEWFVAHGLAPAYSRAEAVTA
jgi:dihydroflavonol-4-reductase